MSKTGLLNLLITRPIVFAALVTCLWSTCILQAQTGQLPPDIVKDFKFKSPDPNLTGRLAFTVKIGSFQRIFSLDLKTGNIMAVISGPGNNFYPTWSPDGTQLVFVSDRDGNDEIYRSTWYGDKVERLTNNKEDDSSPDWGPDENLITFSSGSSSKSQIVQFDITTKSISALTKFDGRDTTPRMAPDGRRVAYSSNRFWPGWEVCIYDPERRSEACPVGGNISACRPFWNKAGTQLLFAQGDGDNITIGLHDIEADQDQKITTMPGREYDPIWGPDDKSVLFVAETDRPGTYEIFIRFLGDRDPKKILASPYSIRYLSWTPRTTLELEAMRIREASNAPVK